MSAAGCCFFKCRCCCCSCWCCCSSCSWCSICCCSRRCCSRTASWGRKGKRLRCVGKDTGRWFLVGSAQPPQREREKRFKDKVKMRGGVNNSSCLVARTFCLQWLHLQQTIAARRRSNACKTHANRMQNACRLHANPMQREQRQEQEKREELNQLDSAANTPLQNKQNH